MIKKLLTLLALGGLSAQAQVTILPVTSVPFNRPLPWSDAGVSNGVPSYTYGNSVTNYGSVGDGVTDDFNAFQNAINACPDGSYTWVPAGTYKVGHTLHLTYPQVMELRGAGSTNTTLLMTSDDQSYVNFWTGSMGATTHNVTANYTKGSFSINCDSVSGFQSGKMYYMAQSYDASIAGGPGEPGSPAFVNQTFVVTNITGTTLSFTPPLVCSYRAGLNPTVTQWPQATYRSGIRGLKLDCRGGPAVWGIQMYGVYQCWAVDCWVTNTPEESITVQRALQCSVLDSRLDGHTQLTTSSRYGIQFSLDTHFCLMQNNMASGHNLAYVIQQGSSCNVCGYNFCNGSWGSGSGYGVPSDNNMYEGIVIHGSFAYMNLIEGNVVQCMDEDPTWDSAPTNTFFRNWVHGIDIHNANPPIVYGRQSLSAPYAGSAFRIYPSTVNEDWGNNIVGNVITRFTPGNTNGISYTFTSDAAPYQFVHGNYDYAASSITWSNGISTNLPASYYLASKPSWMGSYAFPPIGPGVAISSYGQNLTNYVLISAQARFFNSTPPSAPDFNIAGPTNQTVGLGSAATFAVTAPGSPGGLSYQWYRQGTNVSGANSSAYGTGITAAGDNGQTVYCVVTDASGTLTSTNATLTVTNIPANPTTIKNLGRGRQGKGVW